MERKLVEPKTIEQAVANDQALEGFGTPSSAEDYSYCPTCGKVRWLGSCVECDFTGE